MLTAVPFVSAQPLPISQENPQAYFPPAEERFYRPYRVLHTGPLRFGTASWYSESDPGIRKHTANGEIFDESRLACASWDYKFGTRLRVTNLANGKSVICIVNDRGPARRLRRIIDLTKAAYRRIAPLKTGLIRVRVVPVRVG